MGKQNVNAKPSYAFQKLRTQKLFVKYYLLSPLEFIFIYFLQLMTNVSSLYKNSTSIFYHMFGYKDLLKLQYTYHDSQTRYGSAGIFVFCRIKTNTTDYSLAMF